MNSRFFALICVCLSLLIALSGCNKTAVVSVPATTAPTAPPETETEPDPKTLLESLAMIVTTANIQELEQFPSLKEANLSGSTCYSAIEGYIKTHPEVQVTYTVAIGDEAFDSQSESITVHGAGLEEVMDGLHYLHKVTELKLPKTVLSPADLELLLEEYPNVAVQYTIGLLGEEYQIDTEELDLSALQPDQVDEAAAALSQFPNLKQVELMAGNSSSLNKKEVKKLVDAAPNTNFHYSFTLFGQNISTTDETVRYANLSLTSDQEPELRDALAIMTGCKTFILDSCGLSNELLASIRADYDRTELVWRVRFGNGTVLTDVDTIRAVYNVYNETVADLKYCRNVKYIDMGHNKDLTDLSFVAYMPKLEIMIASQTGVSDLTPFENCKNLEFLELVFCDHVSDLSPLSGCTNLKNLNICYTKVSNLLPLDCLPLERFICKRTYVAGNEQKVFKEIHPDCVTMFTGSEPYAGAGWRYVDNGVHYTEIYKKVREVFDYDSLPPT